MHTPQFQLGRAPASPWFASGGRVAALLAIGVLSLGQSARAQGLCFEAATQLPVGSRPSAVAAGDLDQDGVLDLVVANEVSSTVSVLRGLGGGSFAAHVQYAVGDDPYDLALGDLDGDGDLDLVTANEEDSTLTVLRNDGTGAFTLVGNLTAWLHVQSIALGDLDGDGDLDLVSATQGTGLPSQGVVSVHRNLGNATFSAPTHYAAPLLSLYLNVALGDLDADGDLDVVVSDSQHRVLVFANLGGGALGLPVSTPIGGAFPNSIALGDLDADGDLDVVVTGASSNDVVVFANDGTGTLSFASALPVGGASMHAVVRDVDGDGVLDLACAAVPDVGDSTLVILRGLGGLSFAPPQVFPFGLSSNGLSGTGMAAGDFDGDGDLDWVGVRRTSNALRQLRSCSTSGTPTCAGDGSATACPCGNASAPGSGDGCLNSLALAGRLRATGSARVTQDGLVLRGSQMPDSTALYFQGTAAQNGGLGAAFGDGLRCASGSVLRLKSVVNAGGASQFPGLGDPSVSALGGVVAPGSRTYQVWYRNAAAFCTPSTFNLTNGLTVLWAL